MARHDDPSGDRPRPTPDEIAAFVASAPAKVGKREITKAFGLSPDDRPWLKDVLRDLEAGGRLARRGRALRAAGTLPETLVAQIVGRDEDGELVAQPVDTGDGDGPAPRILVQPRRARDGGRAPGMGDRVLLRITASAPDGSRRGGRPSATHEGRIVKVLPKAEPDAIGIFHRLAEGGGRIVPVSKKALGREWLVAPGDENGAQNDELVTGTTARRSRFGPQGVVVKDRLGSLASEKAVSLIAIHAHAIPHVFPPDALAEAERAEAVTAREREDWRDLPLVTIDPPDAKDHDDAVHAAPDTDPANPGGFVLTVAIADVAAYVRPGSALDREALLRGNSVYFPDRVVPMLPERISNDLCSLRPGEARPALAMRMTIGPDGRKIRQSLHRILMRSAAKLSYGQAQAAIDGAPDDATGPLLEPILRPLWAAYAALAAARDARGPLFLDLPERKIVLGPDGTVDRVVVPERLAAHKLIEEFMILANVAAAELLEKAKSPLVYRIHGEPSLEKMRTLGEVLGSIGMKLPKAGALGPALFNGILRQVSGTRHGAFVNEVVLRSQAQAQYAAENAGHFGLNLRRYAHFTSPIRRYADLVVHRALVRAFGLGTDGLPDATTPEDLARVGEQISAAERRAMAAERDTVDRLIAHHLADQIGATFSGRVSGVTKSGLFVKLDRTGADGFIPASTLGAEYFRYEEGRHALVGERTRTTYRLGDDVTVTLVEAAPVAGALRFEMAGSSRPAAGKTGRFGKPIGGKPAGGRTEGGSPAGAKPAKPDPSKGRAAKRGRR